MQPLIGINALVLGSLRTDHAGIALRHGLATAYPPDIGPFVALAEDTPDAWRDLAQLTDEAFLARGAAFRPDGWVRRLQVSLDTMVHTADVPPTGDTLPDTRALTAQDVPAMQHLTELCEIHTFHPGSLGVVEYIGHFDGDQLVAMAGLRFSTPEWREVACVATAPSHRGRGHARRLVLELVARAASSGRRGFLAVETGSPAVRLYSRLGFVRTGTEQIESHTRAV